MKNERRELPFVAYFLMGLTMVVLASGCHKKYEDRVINHTASVLTLTGTVVNNGGDNMFIRDTRIPQALDVDASLTINGVVTKLPYYIPGQNGAQANYSVVTNGDDLVWFTNSILAGAQTYTITLIMP